MPCSTGRARTRPIPHAEARRPPCARHNSPRQRRANDRSRTRSPARPYGREDDRPRTPNCGAFHAHGSPRSGRSARMTEAERQALLDALRAEYAAVYAYGVIAAYASAERTRLVAEDT